MVNAHHRVDRVGEIHRVEIFYRCGGSPLINTGCMIFCFGNLTVSLCRGDSQEEEM